MLLYSIQPYIISYVCNGHNSLYKILFTHTQAWWNIYICYTNTHTYIYIHTLTRASTCQFVIATNHIPNTQLGDISRHIFTDLTLYITLHVSRNWWMVMS